MEKFRISHTILYFKNWYKVTNIVDDLIKTLKADGWVVSNKFDVFNVLVEIVSDSPLIDLKKVILSANPVNCYRCGYYTEYYSFAKKCENVKYDYDIAMIYAIGNELFGLTGEQFIVKEADKEVLPLANNES